MTERLRINWILKDAGMSGGVRTVCQLAEALEARGHQSTIAHIEQARPWPAPWRIRSFARRARQEWRIRGRERHHLETTALDVRSVDAQKVRADDVPDADFVIGTWWETMEWIRDWPAEKGRHAYYVQHYELHGGDPDRIRETYRQPARKIVIARWLERLMAEEFADRECILVPNGLDPEQFEAPPRKLQPQPTVGVMTSGKDWKRTDLAFEAVRLAQIQIPELRLVAFGAGPLSSAQLAGAPAHLDFHLRPPQEAIGALYRSCDAWLLTSDSEGFGLPGLEAAACRCPVLSTRCGGPEDYIEDGVSGFLVDPGDAAALAERIVEVVRMPAPQWEAMSEASQRISERFRWEASAEILEAALLEIKASG